MPDPGATAMLVAFLIAVTIGLLWVAGRQTRQANSTDAQRQSGKSDGLAVAWTVLAVVMALCFAVASGFELVAGEPLVGIALLVASPFAVLGPLTVAHAIRWAARVEESLRRSA